MKNNTLQVGIVGVGRFGTRHLEKWLQIKDAAVCGFYDIDPVVGKRVEEQYNIPLLSQDDLIACSAVIDIVVPASSHYSVAKAALQAGKHVFIEKPFAETPEQARELCSLARVNGGIVGIGYIERFNPVYSALRSHLSEVPEYIEAYRQGPFLPGVGVDVSIILELMIHDIDMVCQLIPYPLRSVSANGERIHTGKIDRASAELIFENGSKVMLHASRAETGRRREMICLDKGKKIVADFMECRLHLNGKDPLTFGKYDAMLDELGSFTKAVRENRPHHINERDGLIAVEIAAAIENSIKINT
ncbi:MAG: Gfo/Idh/MocA family oxidoreductase [FCB group bacterium]|nr:Gfo/Idh/MocA family oxidoreductase [FCB group bacterium]